VLAACGRDSAESDTAVLEHEEPALGVGLDAEERAKLGVELGTAESATFMPGIDGAARVMDAQAVVAAMAELGKAEADARTSQTALKRARDLFQSDAAVSAETLETAERQASADDAQLRVARARAMLSFGAAAPWLDAARREPLLAALTAGSTLLVSASFPAGFGDAKPEALVLRRAGGAAAEGFSATELWTGPADPSVPGPTLFALLAGARSLSSGERLTASVAAGAPLAGVVVPLSSVVLAGAEPWCYVQTEDEVFVRRRVDLARPLPQGYFQREGFAAGERLVVAGAGLLLARELGGGAEEE
jgi:hypothetical protein